MMCGWRHPLAITSVEKSGYAIRPNGPLIVNVLWKYMNVLRHSENGGTSAGKMLQ
jgi:hypothetical protein